MKNSAGLGLKSHQPWGSVFKCKCVLSTCHAAAVKIARPGCCMTAPSCLSWVQATTAPLSNMHQQASTQAGKICLQHDTICLPWPTTVHPAKQLGCVHDAGAGAYQTLTKRVTAPGYPSRTDIAAHVVTIQVPLEGSLQTGGIAFVLKTGQQQWLASRSEGVLRSDFFISTEQASQLCVEAHTACMPRLTRTFLIDIHCHAQSRSKVLPMHGQPIHMFQPALLGLS